MSLRTAFLISSMHFLDYFNASADSLESNLLLSFQDTVWLKSARRRSSWSTRRLRPPQSSESLSVAATGKGGKLFILVKTRKLNRPRSQRHAQHASEKSLLGWFQVESSPSTSPVPWQWCTNLNWNAEDVVFSAFHVKFSRAFFARQPDDKGRV